MYQEWMDGVPLIMGEGFEEHDIEQLQRAKRYYETHREDYFGVDVDERIKDIEDTINKKREEMIERDKIDCMGPIAKRRYIKTKQAYGLNRNEPFERVNVEKNINNYDYYDKKIKECNRTVKEKSNVNKYDEDYYGKQLDEYHKIKEDKINKGIKETEEIVNMFNKVNKTNSKYSIIPNDYTTQSNITIEEINEAINKMEEIPMQEDIKYELIGIHEKSYYKKKTLIFKPTDFNKRFSEKDYKIMSDMLTKSLNEYFEDCEYIIIIKNNNIENIAVVGDK